MLVAEIVLKKVVVVAQFLAERVLVEAIERVGQPFVVELVGRIELIGLPLGTHLPEAVAVGGIGPLIHPAVLVTIVAMHLILEAMADLMCQGLAFTRGVSPAGECEQTDGVVDATAGGLPFICIFQTDDHLVGVGL